MHVTEATGNIFTSYLSHIIFYGLLFIIISIIAWVKGYFKIPLPVVDIPIKFKHVLISFAIYIGITFILSPFIVNFLLFFSFFSSVTLEKKQVLLSLVVNSFVISLIFGGLLTYFFSFSDLLKKGIIKISDSSFLKDILMGIFSWVIAFPLIIVISKTLEMLSVILFKMEKLPEQLAITYIKKTMSSPALFGIVLISICIFAPIIEEFLFRGILQSWLKKKMSRNYAIFFASIFFAFFHYSGSQGISNITIILSLFILSLFLGFIYERQGSLLASISLHATFNTFSVLNLIFIKDI
jgi:membrane protease YdiL (CAAX protease family)